MGLTSDIQFAITGRHTGTADLGTPVLPFALSSPISLANGTGANQADRVFSDQRTLAASANEDLDLAGVLVDSFGNTVTFAKIKAIAIVAAAGNTNNVRVTRPASNGAPLYVAAGDGEDIPPGGFLAKAAPGVAGLGSVAAGTGDLLNIANGGAGTPVTYTIIIIGTSA